MRIRLIIVWAVFMILSNASAQSLDEFSPKENRGTYGPRKFTSKDVYIANFSVNSQLYNLRTATTFIL